MSETDNDSSLVAFRQYYEDNISSLIIFAQRFVPVEVAKDIVHDVFLEVWNHIGSYNELPTRSYLFMAVRNRCINILKREQVKENYINSTELEIRLLGIDYYNSSEKQIIDKEDIQYIHNQIEQLPPKCREIFKMAYFDDKKSVEIAQTLGISIRTVEHQLYLGLKTLRERLTANGKKNLFFLFFF